MQKSKRVLTIDIMRGLTLFLMLFVNDLYAPGVPDWLTHRSADFDGMGLADWVFPGFLFMVGMAVPFAIQSRFKKGDTSLKVVQHILIRVVSLLIIGVLMMNVSRINPELTGISKNLWAILMYVSVFFIWNQYINIKYPAILKGIGILGLLILASLYRSGTPDDVTWLVTGWWGILGLIGWGYLVTSLVYLVVRDRLLVTGLIWLFFIGLNILNQLGFLAFLDFIKPWFGVIIGGSIPSIVLGGLFFSLILRKTGYDDYKKFIAFASILGVLTLLSGFVLRNWFIISKMKGTPSWSLVCTGISIFLFIVLFILIDISAYKKWANVFKPAGQNSLTTYLAPDILYYFIWMVSIPVLFYKQSDNSLIVVLGSVAWAFAMIGFAALLSK
ncbi:MAG: DUF5009 domain-containing protein, partial [Bacteroidales bacterium]|nr:DUF5009 domain-containing protein [Bacteroidales bacterium]